MAQLQRGGSLSRRYKFGETSVPIAAKHTMEQLHNYSQFVRRLHHMDVEARLPQELDFLGEHEGNLAPTSPVTHRFSPAQSNCGHLKLSSENATLRLSWPPVYVE
jgi:hypothetical protein